jgi:uncharacterized membrane protein
MTQRLSRRQAIPREGGHMSHLYAVAYPDESRAAEAMATVQQIAAEKHVDLQDAVYVTRGRDGSVRLHHNDHFHLSAKGALHGGLVGLMVGMFAFIPGLGLLGAGLGAVAGRWKEHGIDDRFMKELSEHLKPGSSAIFVLTRNATPKVVQKELRKHGGTVLQTTLSEEQEATLKAAGIET